MIRQLKGERDSLFDELKTLQKNILNAEGGSGMPRNLSRKKLLTEQLSPQSIKREPIKPASNMMSLNSAKSYQSNPFALNQR